MVQEVVNQMKCISFDRSTGGGLRGAVGSPPFASNTICLRLIYDFSTPNIRSVRISGGGLRGAVARDARPRTLPRLSPNIRYVRLLYDLFVA